MVSPQRDIIETAEKIHMSPRPLPEPARRRPHADTKPGSPGPSLHRHTALHKHILPARKDSCSWSILGRIKRNLPSSHLSCSEPLRVRGPGQGDPAPCTVRPLKAGLGGRQREVASSLRQLVDPIRVISNNRIMLRRVDFKGERKGKCS